MKKLINILAQTTLLWMIGCDSKPTTDDLGLVPLPSSISIAKRQTLINSQWAVTQNDGHKDLNSLKEILSENLYSDYGLLVSDFSSKTINLNIIEDNNSYGEEGYHLSVSDQTVQINAGTPNGIFYGIQTFRQLLDSGKKSNQDIQINQIEIKDNPRFKWRGMHLDVGRHFFDIGFVKRYIDYIAMHKMNIFHWHLTEDQGWRVEIDAYPKLTNISAFRDESLIGHYSDKPHQYDGKRYGGLLGLFLLSKINRKFHPISLVTGLIASFLIVFYLNQIGIAWTWFIGVAVVVNFTVTHIVNLVFDN